jgi:hypothetical protein
MKTERGWLIELPEGGHATWYCPNRKFIWTVNAGEAVRFVREKDAQAIIDWFGLKPAIATEHVWHTDDQALAAHGEGE